MVVARPGHTTTLAYDGSGNLSTVTDAWGRVVKFFYITISGNTRLNEIREPAPGDVGWYSTFLQYDGSYNLASITNPIGETTRFEYTSGKLTSAIDGHGNATQYAYDGSGRVTTITDPNDPFEPPPPSAVTASITYTSSTSHKFTNRLGKDTVYTFDASGRVTKIHDALGNETEFEWDSTTWELTALYGPKIALSGGHWSRQKNIFTYGISTATQHELWINELRKVTDTNSTGTSLKQESWTYNAWHDPDSYTDARSKLWTIAYQLDGSFNSTGLITTITSPLSIVKTTNTYDSAHLYRLTSFENGVGKTWSYAYNQNTTSSYGTPDKVTTPEGNITNYWIDIRGRAYQVTDPTGNPIQTEYDPLDRAVRVINADGTASERMFDCCHLVAELDENKTGTKYEFDWMGRLAKQTDANGDETFFTYDLEGRVLTITDARANLTTNTYDDIGRLTEVDFPGGWTETYTYWEPGMLKTKTNTKGMTSSTIDYDYDDFYRLSQKTFPSGTPTTYAYDAGGLRTNMTDASGEKRYTWDDDGRLTKIEQGPAGFTSTNINYTLDYQWTDADQKSQVKLTIRTLSAIQWDLDYTDDGNLSHITNPDGEVTKHEYLPDGRLKKITLRSTDSSHKATREFFYQDTDSSHSYVADKNRHLRKTLDKTQTGTTIVSFDYELDAAGRRLSVTDKDGKYTAYQLDPLGQLKAETKWSAKTPGTKTWQYAYTLDPNGNRLQQFHNGGLTAYTFGDNNEMTSAGAWSVTYDHFGNTTQQTDGTNTYNFTWDFESRLIQATGAGTDTHENDGDGRRMRSKLNAASDWTSFIWDEADDEACPVIIAEYKLVSGSFSYLAQNTWGIGIISTNRGGNKRYFHFDAFGHTAALTDNLEAVQDTYVYSFFGVTESSTGSTVNPYRFLGQRGAYDDGARGSGYSMLLLEDSYYRPAEGHFLNSPSEPMVSDKWKCTKPPPKLGIIGRFFNWCIKWIGGGTKDIARSEYCQKCKGLCDLHCDELDLQGEPGFDYQACLDDCKKRWDKCRKGKDFPPVF